VRFDTSDPDIATIVRRIERNVIDLQPDFQRGEVWSAGKKQRLIDSILRKWHVPPIHLVAKSGGKYDVLDGQQRLTAIRDFVRGKFAIDGDIEPHDSRLVELDGLRYFDLPEDDNAELSAMAQECYQACSTHAFDQVPLAALHPTIRRVGFMDEIDHDTLNAIFARAEALCSEFGSFPLTVGPLAASRGCSTLQCSAVEQPVQDL
jgi:hypothetical protein